MLPEQPVATDDSSRRMQSKGDKIFLKLLADEAPFFSLKLRYEGEKLVEAVVNGESVE